jgi:hypothetical protein
MSTFVRLILLFFVASLTPLLIFFLSIRLSGMNVEMFKQQLRDANIYETLQKQGMMYLTASARSHDGGDAIAIVEPIIKREITSDYIEGKVETLIDDIDSWGRGTTTQEPTISFSDLKQKLTGGNPKMLAQFLTLSKQLDEELKKQHEAMAAQMQKEGSPETLQALPDTESFNLEKMIQSDMSYPLGKYMRWVKPMYLYFRIGLMTTAILMGISLVLIFLFSADMVSKYRWIGATLLISAISSLPIVFSVFGINTAFPHAAADGLPGIPAFVLPVVLAMSKPLITSYLETGKYIIGGFTIAGIVLIIMSFTSTAAPAVVTTAPKPKTVKKK